MMTNVFFPAKEKGRKKCHFPEIGRLAGLESASSVSQTDVFATTHAGGRMKVFLFILSSLPLSFSPLSVFLYTNTLFQGYEEEDENPLGLSTYYQRIVW